MLVAAYPHTTVSRETVMLYVRAIADVDLADGIRIVMWWLAHSKRWPSIADLREQIAIHRGEATPDLDKMWAEVRRRFTYPRDKRPPFSHPAIEDAVMAIGEDEIGMSTEPEIVRAQLGRAYEAAKRRYESGSTTKFVEGMVGDAKRAIIAGPTKLLGKGR